MEPSLVFLTSMVLLALAAFSLLLYTTATVGLPVMAFVALIMVLVVANGGIIP